MDLNLKNNDLRFYYGLVDAVKERGEDWTYPEKTAENIEWFSNTSARYTKDWVCVNRKADGSAACIVGLAAEKAGLDVHSGGSIISNGDLLGLSGRVIKAVMVGQVAQDSGKPWGTALKEIQQALLAQGYDLPKDEE